MEGGALVQAALDPDAPAVHLDELLGDAQAEAGATELARDGRVDPAELGEYLGELVRRDADPGVRHAVAHAVAVARGADRDAAALGELEGVAGEVEQALRDALRVAAQHLGQAGIDLDLELEPLLLGERA